MSITLLKKEMKSNGILLIIFMAVLSMYASMIIMMFDPKLGDSLKMMAESMPDLFSAFGMADVGTTLLEFVTGYLYGLLLIAFPSVFIVILSNRLVAKYVDNGSMAYLLAVPEKRRKIVTTQAIVLLLGILVLVIYVAGLILMIGQILFPGEMEVEAFIRVNIGLIGLLVFLGGTCFCVSCICNESKNTAAINTAIVVYSILAQMISQVGDKFEKVKYITPITLFDVNGLSANSGESWIMCGILYVAGIVFVCIGILSFSKRDLPL